MNVDIKHDLLKNFLSSQMPGKQNVHTTIDQSMIAGPGSKSLGMDLQTENDKNNEKKKKKEKQKLEAAKALEANVKKQSILIVRDPSALLKLF